MGKGIKVLFGEQAVNIDLNFERDDLLESIGSLAYRGLWDDRTKEVTILIRSQIKDLINDKLEDHAWLKVFYYLLKEKSYLFFKGHGVEILTDTMKSYLSSIDGHPRIDDKEEEEEKEVPEEKEEYRGLWTLSEYYKRRG